MLKRGPARYRSRETGRFASEDFAREHPDEAYVSRHIPTQLVGAVAAGMIGIAAVAAGRHFYRAHQ